MIGEASVQPHLELRAARTRMRAWKAKDIYSHSQGLCCRVSKDVPDVINAVHSRGICAYILIPIYFDIMLPKLE